jgi:hypothetical protein
MPCTICAALNREHSHECEAEASATIKRRSELTASRPTDSSAQDQLDQEVLRSRKRQAHLAFELHQHRAKHAEMAKAASR